MKYISAEEFLSRPREVQKVFRRWWKPEMYDLFFRDFGNNENTFLNGIYESCIQDYETQNNATKDSTFLPLLTEGQLRQFIEDKTSCIVELDYDGREYNGYCIYLRKGTDDDCTYPFENFEELGEDVLQAYWQIACRIATK